jgi:hypothetical protein
MTRNDLLRLDDAQTWRPFRENVFTAGPCGGLDWQLSYKFILGPVSAIWQTFWAQYNQRSHPVSANEPGRKPAMQPIPINPSSNFYLANLVSIDLLIIILS